MKTFRVKPVFLALGLAILIATAIAAVPGIFSSVNSTNGYKVNGSAGSSGQALCSDGTYFKTPCSLFNQLIEQSGSAMTQRQTLNLQNGTNTTVLCTDNSGLNRTDCQINAAAVPPLVTQTDYTGSRAFSTDYTASGVPTQVEITISTLASSECTGAGIYATASVGATAGTQIPVLSGSISNDCLGTIPLSFLVPAGYSYRVVWTTVPGRTTPSSVQISNWTELTW